MNYKNNYTGFISTDMTEIKKGTYENPIFTTDDEYLIKLINITPGVKQLTENAADKLKTIPLNAITNKPGNLTGYIKIHNQYWPVDKNNNVFFIDSRAIYGANKRTVYFYIERLKLPVGSYKPIKLKEAWIKREYGESEVRRRIGRK